MIFPSSNDHVELSVNHDGGHHASAGLARAGEHE
jgi:hypothetical protein